MDEEKHEKEALSKMPDALELEVVDGSTKWGYGTCFSLAPKGKRSKDVLMYTDSVRVGNWSMFKDEHDIYDALASRIKKYWIYNGIYGFKWAKLHLDAKCNPFYGCKNYEEILVRYDLMGA